MVFDIWAFMTVRLLTAELGAEDTTLADVKMILDVAGKGYGLNVHLIDVMDCSKSEYQGTVNVESPRPLPKVGDDVLFILMSKMFVLAAMQVYVRTRVSSKRRNNAKDVTEPP